MKYFKWISNNLGITFLVALIFFINCQYSCAQTNKLTDELLTLKASSDSAAKIHPSEKLYLQLDKPYYALGDTIWLKAYLFNAPTLLFSAKSGLLHIDITSDSGKLVKQYILPVSNGVGWGNINLDSIDFKSGTYTLRAYTNWMRNFGVAGFYYRQFYIAGHGENSWLINSKISRSGTNDKQTVNAKLQFTDINKLPVANVSMQLKVYAGTKNWYKQQVQTDENGALDVNFTLPVKSSNLAIVAQSGQEGRKAIIPVNLNRPEKADIQFLPEGGSLVGGLPANVGFKAIGEDGKGIDVSGIITDHTGQQVAAFQSLHSGMGSFHLLVNGAESYTAKVTLASGTVKEYPLPAIKSSGTVLLVKNVMDSDSVEVSITATDDIIRSGNNYFLIGKSRGIICYAATFEFRNNSIRKKIAASLFPSGITHFILTTTSGQALNERLTYIDHHDNLHIELTTNKADYAPRDSISLRLRVTDKDRNPIAGNFTMAVTDNAQVENDTLKQDNIISHTLFSSELKGYIKDPGYYMQTKNAQAWQALDNLLLTQGWVNYDWQVDNQHVAFTCEPEMEITGRVLNGFNKPIQSQKVELFSKSPILVKDTLTDKEGLFTFSDFPRIDTPAFFIKTVKRDFNVAIKVDEPEVPAFNSSYPAAAPWYVNSNGVLINYTKQRDSISNQFDNLAGGGHRLNEVKIISKKIVKGSANPNGPGNADIVIDEKDLDKAGKKSLFQLLQEKIKGFRNGILTITGNPYNLRVIKDRRLSRFVTDGKGYPMEWFFIDDKPIKFIIDGKSYFQVFNVPAPPGNLPESSSYASISEYLKFFSAEEVKGIEINTSSKYTSRYVPMVMAQYVGAADVDFIEITTRTGNGPGMTTNSPGTYLYKPLPLSYPAQFYKPKYPVNDTIKHLPDLRSTIDWEPNVVTNKDGDAFISFYSADRPAEYTIIVEGTDGNGNLGYGSKKISVKGKETSKSK